MERRPAMNPSFKTRSEYILSLIPKDKPRDEDDESDCEEDYNKMSHDILEKEADKFLSEFTWSIDSPDGTAILIDNISDILDLPNDNQKFENIPKDVETPIVGSEDMGHASTSRYHKTQHPKPPLDLPDVPKQFENVTKYVGTSIVGSEEMGCDLPSRPHKIQQPKPPLQKKGRKIIKKKKINYKWKRGSFKKKIEIIERIEAQGMKQHQYDLNKKTASFLASSDEKAPIDFFLQFFTEEVIDTIVQQTNLYSTQRTGVCANISKDDILDFISIILIMGIVSMPATDDYWSEAFRFEKVASIMPRNKFRKIRQFLHFADNTKPANGDKFFKVRSIVELVRTKFQEIEGEGKYSIDEMMCPYKGKKAGCLRQYLRNKPVKWGFKFLVRCGVSGIIHDFLLYSGEGTFHNINFKKSEESFSFTEKVIVALSNSIKNKSTSVLYFDNWYTTPDIMTYLRKEYGILCLGTLRQDRIRGAPFISDKEMKKNGRGSFDQLVDNKHNIALVKWYDNKSVIVGSNFLDAYPTSSVERWSSETKSRISVTLPAVVKQYNVHMGGVDLADMLIALYRTSLRSHRYHLNIFAQLIDMCVSNAWLLFRRNHKNAKIGLKNFREILAHELLLFQRKKKGTKSRTSLSSSPRTFHSRSSIPESVRFDGREHWPVHTNKGKCRLCKTAQTRWQCSKCDLRLCLNEHNNCFVEFHRP